MMLQATLQLSQSNSRWHWGTVLKLTLREHVGAWLGFWGWAMFNIPWKASLIQERLIQPRLRLQLPIRRQDEVVPNLFELQEFLRLVGVWCLKGKKWGVSCPLWPKSELGQCNVSVLMCTGCRRVELVWMNVEFRLSYGSVSGVLAAPSLAGFLNEPSQGVSELRQLKDLAIQQLQQRPQTLPEILLFLLVLLQPLLCSCQLLLQHSTAKLCLLDKASLCHYKVYNTRERSQTFL